ncbi:MAG TPA: hypothetical protein GXX49_02550 [Clostridiaceae bacterium]|nr:hypothetical protein [Clostridiaceae bacterium]
MKYAIENQSFETVESGQDAPSSRRLSWLAFSWLEYSGLLLCKSTVGMKKIICRDESINLLSAACCG